MAAARRTAACLAALVATAAGACTDTELRCAEPSCTPQAALALPDSVTASGRVCTLDPARAPYPFKVLFVVDTSASTRDSDPAGGRGRAVHAALDKYQSTPGMSFALVTFSTKPVPVQPTFTQDRAKLTSAADQADRHQEETNYLDTLDLVAKIISDDAAASRVQDRAFTQYSVQWLSDGNPEAGPLPLANHCAQSRPKVRQKVADLMALPKRLGFLSLTVDTIYLTGAFVSPCIELARQDRSTYGIGPDYLQDMARAGGGGYQEAAADAIAFAITPTFVNRRFDKHGFFLLGASRVVEGDTLLPDSNRDGLADAPGADNTGGASGKTCAATVARRLGANVELCQRICARDAAHGGMLADPTGDNDLDGLRNCEEVALTLDPNHADSDGDGLTDDLELRFGTNPGDPGTGDLDSDRDGMSDLSEVLAGTDPLSPQKDGAFAYQYLPLTEVDSGVAGVSCYNFEVANIRLAQTLAGEAGALGDNLLCLLMLQHGRDDPDGEPVVTRACKTANFRLDNEQSRIVPEDGRLTFVAEDFVPVICPAAQATLCQPAASEPPAATP